MEPMEPIAARAVPGRETKTMPCRGGEARSPPKPAHSIEEIFCGKLNSRETWIPPDLAGQAHWRAPQPGELLALVLPFFIHVFDRGLVDHQIGLARVAVHFDATPVVPLDD